MRTLTIKQGLIDFASNDFLGFARCAELKERIMEKWTELNIGSTGSRLLTGNHLFVEKLEQQLACFYGSEAALIFTSGYTANLGLLSALLTADDVVLHDAHSHASTIDGIRLSRAKRFSFHHNDLDHLEKRFKMHNSKGNLYVCVESVYSCDGSLAPLKEMAQLCDQHGARLIVDEAHATGIIGCAGRGLVQALGIPFYAKVHTFSKALGAHGAVVIGSDQLKHHLINFSRPFIYTTALPYPILIAIQISHEALQTASNQRNRLAVLISYFKACISTLSQTQIQTIVVPGREAAMAMADKLQKKGFDIRALCAPTVPIECLRICLHSFNSEEQIKNLCAELS